MRGTYKYLDTNMGGNWRSTNPKAIHCLVL